MEWLSFPSRLARAVRASATVLALAGAIAPAGAAGEAVRVFVTIPPQAYLVEQVGGARVRVDVLVRPGLSPHAYEPTPRQVAALARARVFFTMGTAFDARITAKMAAAFRGVEVVDMSRGVKRRFMAADHGDCDHHGPGAHGEAAQHAEADARQADPHLWLDPRNGMLMAEVVRASLARVDPEGAGEYAARAEALLAKLRALDAEIRRELAPLRGAKFYVFHPAFGYFADAYGLEQVPIEVEGKEPSPRQLADLVRRARREGVRVIFVQRQFSSRAAGAVASAIGGVVVPLDPLGYDYLEGLRDMAGSLRKALRAEGGDDARRRL